MNANLKDAPGLNLGRIRYIHIQKDANHRSWPVSLPNNDTTEKASGRRAKMHRNSQKDDGNAVRSFFEYGHFCLMKILNTLLGGSVVKISVSRRIGMGVPFSGDALAGVP